MRLPEKIWCISHNALLSMDILYRRSCGVIVMKHTVINRTELIPILHFKYVVSSLSPHMTTQRCKVSYWNQCIVGSILYFLLRLSMQLGCMLHTVPNFTQTYIVMSQESKAASMSVSFTFSLLHRCGLPHRY